eukprot:CCRYP_017721-RA/>CCRYP_017721-RA protein AED:0.04 eAED:0.04 QI:91/1/1/1/0.5/0.4/5/62/729
MHHHIRHAFVGAALLAVSSALECPEVTDFCTDPESTFGLPLLDLSPGGTHRPTIDGAIDANGYGSFLELPMFNDGKNGETGSPLDKEGRIATAYLAYDHVHEILCVAALLDPAFLTDPETSSIEVVEKDEESWVQFGVGMKLIESTANEFEYIAKQVDSTFTIGYEGCWNIDYNDPEMGRILNNYVQVHFNRKEEDHEGEESVDRRMLNEDVQTGGEGESTSTGIVASDGRLICLTPTCVSFDSPPTPSLTATPSSRPTVSSSPTCDYTTIDAIKNEVTTPVNTPIDIKVLDNDVTAADRSPLDIEDIPFSGNHGECAVGVDGVTITYTPNTDYYGTDTCIYTTCDAKHRCDSAAIIIYVTPVIANDDVATTEINTPVSVYPLDNDTSFAGTVLSVVSITESATNGECLVMNSQIVVYIPKPNFHGVDSCTYTACVSSALCDSAVITVTVEGEPCDDKPTRNIEITMRPSLRPTTRQPTLKPIVPTSVPTNEPTNKPTPKPTQTPTKKPSTNAPTYRPTNGPTKKPTPKPTPTPTKKPTPKPTQQPTTPEPTAAPTTCGSRMFHYVNGCCTNVNYAGSGHSYSTMRDCCNDKFRDGCCTFEDVCHHGVIDRFAPTPPSSKPTMKPTSNFSGVCYDEWEPKYYAPGDKVTGSNGKNYQCDADYYLYCAQYAFQPGSGMASELAWNQLPSTCTQTRRLKSNGCTVYSCRLCETFVKPIIFSHDSRIVLKDL